MKHLLAAVVLLTSVSAFGQNQFQDESAKMFTAASDKIMQLAEAMPDDKLDWSPAEGVRSFGDVLTHVISANYFFATKLGAELPEGVNMETLADDLSSKADYSEALQQSIDLAKEAIMNADESMLSEKVEFPFPGDYTGMSTVMIITSHANEHLAVDCLHPNERNYPALE